jgi:hypothetical protein
MKKKKAGMYDTPTHGTEDTGGPPEDARQIGVCSKPRPDLKKLRWEALTGAGDASQRWHSILEGPYSVT